MSALSNAVQPFRVRRIMMIMVFAPLFAAFSKFKLHIADSPGSKVMAIADGTIPTTFESTEKCSGRAINGNMLEEQTADRYRPTFQPTAVLSSINLGLGNSEHDRLDGVVTIDIHPNRLGQIKFAGGWWSAKCERSMILKIGTLVKVIGRENIILIVEPIGSQPNFIEQVTELI
ncbi:MAG: NfeD family protein [Cyanobacteria bacterium P01_F01_bin.150]